MVGPRTVSIRVLKHSSANATIDSNTFLKDSSYSTYIHNKNKVERSRHWVTWTYQNQPLFLLHKRAIETLVQQQKQSLHLEEPPSYQEWLKESAFYSSSLQSFLSFSSSLTTFGRAYPLQPYCVLDLVFISGARRQALIFQSYMQSGVPQRQSPGAG